MANQASSASYAKKPTVKPVEPAEVKPPEKAAASTTRPAAAAHGLAVSTLAKSGAGGKAVSALASGKNKSTAPLITMPKGPTHGSKVSQEARLRRKGIAVRNGIMYYMKNGQMVHPPASAPAAPAPAARSAGFNPFGLPADKMADAIINSQRKKR